MGERFKHSLHSSCSSAVAPGLWREVCRAWEAKRELTGGSNMVPVTLSSLLELSLGVWRTSCATSPSRRSATRHRRTGDGGRRPTRELPAAQKKRRTKSGCSSGESRDTGLHSGKV